MSWDFEVGPAEYRHKTFEANVTYNSGPILRLAGFDPALLNGVTADVLRARVLCVYQVLVDNPEYFKKYEPKNGWGDYDSCMEFIRNLTTYLIDAPDDYILKVF
jgi:hypothetical protein